jgi:SpoVK/Ycf46/Vps4 family AAA+-type ATPase
MSYDKIPEPPRRFEKRQICWCGNPNCPGEKSGNPFIAAEASNGANDMSIFNGRNDMDRMREMMIREVSRNMDRRINDSFFLGSGPDRSTSNEPTQPAALKAARETVKEYLLEVNHDTAWDDVVGNDAARSALMEAIEEPKNHPDLYEYYGMKPPKGVMLFGPPGCGKTMFAKAAAAAVSRVYGTKAEVMVINGPSIQSPYIGKTEETIRNIFRYAREYQAFHKHPLTVFFDEAEVLFPDRTGRTRRVSPWEESNVAQFLSEMDGMNSVGAFVILATNRPEAIDEALLRDGRCDRKIKVERPTKQAVEHIVRKTLQDAPLGADIEDLVMAAAESFFNPHYVIQEGHIISGMINAAGDAKIKDTAVNFCLEHIVSGAMATGVSRRARSSAFARDRVSGKREGITVTDVLEAVKEIFEENKPLEHAFALREFIDGLHLKEMLEPKGRVQ